MDDDDDLDSLRHLARFRWFVFSLGSHEEAYNNFIGRRVFLWVAWPLQATMLLVELLFGGVYTGMELDGFVGRAWTALFFGATASAIVGPAWVKSAALEHHVACLTVAKVGNNLVRCVAIASSQRFDAASVAASINSTGFLLGVPLLDGVLPPVLNSQLISLGIHVGLIPLVACYAGIGRAIVAPLTTWAIGVALGNLVVVYVLKPTWACAIRSRLQARLLRRRFRQLEVFSETSAPLP